MNLPTKSLVTASRAGALGQIRRETPALIELTTIRADKAVKGQKGASRKR